MGSFEKIILFIALGAVLLGLAAYMANYNLAASELLGFVLIIIFSYIFTIALLNINKQFFPNFKKNWFKLLCFILTFVLIWIVGILRSYLLLGIVFLLVIAAGGYSLDRFIEENKKKKAPSVFGKRKNKAEDEFDGIVDFLGTAIFSVLLMSLGLYGAMIYGKNEASYILGGVFFLAGVLFYLLNKCGRELVIGLMATYFKFKKKPKLSKMTGLNVSLGFAWFIVALSIIAVFFIYHSFVTSSTQIDLQTFSDIASAILLVAGIFSALVVMLAEKVKIRTITLLHPMILCIIVSFGLYFMVAFSVPLLFILMLTNVAFLLVYTSYGVILFYLKKSFTRREMGRRRTKRKSRA